MATLTENVARVTSALADIKDAIINKGVTPTGKCETFASAIASIPTSSGANVKYGTFTSSTSDVTVNCGFRPSKIMVFSGYEASGVFPDAAYYYVNGSQKYVGARAASIGAASNTVTFITVTSSGFKHRAPNSYYASLNTYYIAVE